MTAWRRQDYRSRQIRRLLQPGRRPPGRPGKPTWGIQEGRSAICSRYDDPSFVDQLGTACASCPHPEADHSVDLSTKVAWCAQPGCRCEFATVDVREYEAPGTDIPGVDIPF